MHDEDGFLSAIRQAPADDVARLVFADWLDEQDDPACKLKAGFIRLELQLAEAPQESLNRFRCIVQLQKLAAAIDPAWLVVVSHPKLEVCRLRFQVECPKRWGALLPTANPRVRFCKTCKKHVRYCETIDEARNHVSNGNCVTVTLALLRRRFDLHPPQPGPPRFIAPARGRRLVARPPQPPGQPDSSPPVPTVELERSERHAGERPKWKQERKKRQRQRNIQRENWEEME